MTRTTSRHGKPPNELWTSVVIGGSVLGAAAIIGLTAFTGLGDDPVPAPSSVAAAAVPAGTAAPEGAVDDPVESAPDEDGGVLAYLEGKDAPHLKDVRWSGDFLRIYTDLDEYDYDDPAARTLCDQAVDYLAQTHKDIDPVVFVHAKKSGNGNVVLVNNTNGKCRAVQTK